MQAPARISSSKSRFSSPLLGDHQAQQVLDVLGVELRRVGGHVAGQVLRRDDLDAVLDHGLAALGQLGVTARVAREVDDHRARRHVAHALGGHQDRRLAPGDLRRGDDHVLLGGVLVQGVADLLVLLLGQRAGVAALVLGVGDEVELQRAPTQRRDLLPGGAADVEAGDDRPQALGGRDRLQAGDARAQHQDLGRGDGSRRRGHHREEATGLAGGEEGRRVTGDVGLRGQRVHRLGTGDPRDRLHRERRHASGGERLRGLARRQRGQMADVDLARAEVRDLAGGRDGHLRDHVGAPGVVA